MAHDITIRLKCRALFEVLDMSLSEINKQEIVGVSTLSDWKNDDREEFGGIWIKGCKVGEIEKAGEKLKQELQATSVYDEMQKKLTEYNGINKKGHLKLDGLLNVADDNAQLQVQIEADTIMLATIQADWFDAQLLKNSMLSSIMLNNKVKNTPDKVTQSEIKTSSETHKIAKESRFGKSPDTMILNVNGDYTKEELADMSLEDLEKLHHKEQQNLLEATPENEHPKKDKILPQ